MDLRVEPQSLQRRAVEKLRSAILSGHFKPGDRLVEARLCESLGISRASVRESLRALEAERLIEIVPNRGPQIPIITWHQAEQIYQVRALLEGEAAALCAERIDKDGVIKLNKACDSFKLAAENANVEECIKATAEFYKVILSYSDNVIIEEILASLNARINFLRGRSMSMKGRTQFSLREMRAIAQAIKNKTPAAARRAAIDHVEKARMAAKSHYEQTILKSSQSRTPSK